MGLHCGVDLHGDNGFYGIADEDGKRVYKKRLPNSDFFRLAEDRDPLLWLEPGSVEEILSKFPQHADEVFSVGAVADSGAGQIAICTTMLTDFYATPDPEAAVEALMRNLLDLP